MSEKQPTVKALWFSILMSIVSLGMFVEYTRLVLTTDDSPRKIVALVVWRVMAIAWIATSVVRLRVRRIEN